MPRPLRVGDAIPPFTAEDHAGRVWSNALVTGAPFVLYFYPKDETPGCKVEAGAFRDAWDEFRALDLLVLGVSRDDVESHRAFVERQCLPFVLLSDPDGAMHRAFGALHLGGLPRRVSYLVDAGGRVAAVFDSHLQPAAHAERMLDAARALKLANA